MDRRVAFRECRAVKCTLEMPNSSSVSFTVQSHDVVLKGFFVFFPIFFFLPHSDRASFALSLELRVQLVPYIPPLPDCRTLEIMDGGGSSVFAQ